MPCGVLSSTLHEVICGSELQISENDMQMLSQIGRENSKLGRNNQNPGV